MKKARKITSIESRKGNAAQTLAHPGHSIWGMLGIVVRLGVIFKYWKALPEAHRKTTPGKAVGFLFIPFFNFYWVFVSFPALAKGYYSYGKQVNDPEIKDMSGLGIAYAVLFVVGFWIASPTPALTALTAGVGIAEVMFLGIGYAALFVGGFASASPIPALPALMAVVSIADVVVLALFFKAMSTYANGALSRGASVPPPAPSAAW